MINLQSVFLLVAVFSLGEGQLGNVPQYDELVNMAATRFHSSFVDNFTEPMIDLQSMLKSANYLDNEAQTLGWKYSDNPSLLNIIRHSFILDMCQWLQPNVSIKCCTDLKVFFKSLLLKKMWAIKMIDSYGKPPSGLYLGDVFYPGSFDECLDPTTAFDPSLTADPKQQKLFNPKYCQIGIHIPKLTNLLNPNGILTVGICVPDSCAASDIKYLFNTGIASLQFWIGDQKNRFVCHEEQKFDLQAISTLAMCGVIVFLLILGTIYDLISIQLSKGQKHTVTVEQQSEPESLEMTSIKKTSSTSESTEELEPTQLTTEPGKLRKFLLCFSLYRNASNLLNTDLPTDNLAAIHGLRFISMTWIILGHTYLFGVIIWKNNAVLVENAKSFTFQAIGNATISTDSFFLFSGMLVVYVGLKVMKNSDTDVDWLYFYVHRFWRLTPTYMLVLMVYVLLVQYWGDGPYWPHNGIEENYCRHNWWQNFLYINNFFDKQCMGWMWYVAIDMQFYIFSPFILILLNRKAYRGLILLLLLLVGQCVLTGFLWISKYRDPRMEAAPDIYMRPYTRVGPYLVGMAYGYLLHKNNKVAINRFLSVLTWLLASACAVSVLYGLYGNDNGHLMTKEIAAIYIAMHRSVWAVAVGWVIYACTTGNGGFVNRLLCWKPFIPLSRLTYCAYLVHPIVIFTYILRQRFPIYVTNFRAAQIYLGHLCMTYLVAFVVSMTFEAPMTALEKIFIKK